MTTLTGQLWERAYAVHIVWPDDQSGLVALLHELTSSERQGSEMSLLRGYLAYHFPCDATRGIEIEAELKRASEDESIRTTAHLYLAHYYYDSQRFVDALKELQKLDRTRFEEAGQIWRSLKIRELILSAKLFLASSYISSDDLTSFAFELRKAGVENAPIPNELIDALLANKSAVVRDWTMHGLVNVVTALRTAIDEIAEPNTLKEKTDLLVA